MNFDLINPSIKAQIQEEMARLEHEPHYHIRRRKRIFSALKREADKHSAEIELSNGETLSGRKTVKYMATNLANAHNYFCANFTGLLDRDIIFETWVRLAPDIGTKKFRSPYDGLCFANRMRAYPENVYKELENFLEENNGIEDVLDRALHAHLHLARVHPFSDGNGRLARLVQNGLLLLGEYPPIVIEPTDRTSYMDLICQAQNSYEEGDGSITLPQSKFYNYLAMNLWSSLRQARKMVDKKAESVRIYMTK